MEEVALSLNLETVATLVGLGVVVATITAWLVSMSNKAKGAAKQGDHDRLAQKVEHIKQRVDETGRDVEQLGKDLQGFREDTKVTLARLESTVLAPGTYSVVVKKTGRQEPEQEAQQSTAAERKAGA